MDEGAREVELDDMRYQTSSGYHGKNHACIASLNHLDCGAADDRVY